MPFTGKPGRGLHGSAQSEIAAFALHPQDSGNTPGLCRCSGAELA